MARDTPPEAPPSRAAWDYDGFLSYSHAADHRLSAALQTALRRFAKPWYRRRALRLFRDQTDLSLDPSLWSGITEALDRSAFFVLLASPGAARSEWVQREVAHWLERRGAERILVVVTRGRVRWDDVARRFDPAETDALPASLLEAFPDEPLYLDLRWATAETDLSLQHPGFRDAVATLAAALHGRPKDELLGEDVEQHRRTRRTAWAAGVGLVLLTVASVAGAVTAVRQRDAAEAERRIALSRQLAAQATSLLGRSPEALYVSLALGVEASRLHASPETDGALRAALALTPAERRRFEYHDRVQPALGRIRALASSPDGRLLGAARDDGTAEIWDLERGESRAVLAHDGPPGATPEEPDGTARWKAPGLGEEVTTLAFGPDASLVATAGNDGTARIWTVPDGAERHRLVHGGPVRAVAFDPTGRYLATGSEDGTARLWDVRSGGEMARHPHAEEVGHVAFSPDGRRLAALGEAGEITLLDVAGGPPRGWWSGSAFSYGGVAFSPDGTLLATGHDEGARVWDVQTGHEVIRVAHTDFGGELDYNSPIGIYRVAFSPDGRFLATAARDATARVWDVATGAEVVRLGHGAPVTQVAFLSDGSGLATAADDGLARLWEIPSGRELLRMVHGATETLLSAVIGDRSLATGNDQGLVQVWHLDRGDQRAELRHPAAVVDVAFHPSGESMATVDDDDAVRVWSAEGELRAERLDPNDTSFPWFNVERLTFSEDGRTLALTGQRPALALLDPAAGLRPTVLADYPDFAEGYLSPRHLAAADWRTGRLRLWNPATPERPVELETEALERIAFGPTGRHLVTRHDDGTFRVWRIPEADVVGTVRAERPVSAFALHPEGTLLALATDEPGEERPGVYPPRERLPRVHVWDLGSGTRKARLPLAEDPRRVAFDRTGTLLLAVTATAVHVWRAPDLDDEPRVLRHRGAVDGVRTSADGRWIATGSDGRVHVWAASNGRLVAELSDRGRIRGFEFAPDGRHVLTGGSSGHAILWRWRTEDLVTEACRRLARPLSVDEWRQYVGDAPYRPACGPSPGGGDGSASPPSGEG